MRNTQRAQLVAALAIAVATAGCGIGTGQPIRPSTSTGAGPGPSAFAPSPSPTTSMLPAGNLSEFDSGFRAAVEDAMGVRLAGLPPTDAPTPMCQAIGEPASPARFCIAAFPPANPVVTITANAAGSTGATGFMMAMASMPDGIQGTVLPAPVLGDAASLARSWSDRGCTAVLAVRDGTLIVSVQVRLSTDATSSDCGLDVPTDYLETVARTLLDNLHAFRGVGLPIDDPVARDRAAKLITDGKLRPGERDLIALPTEFANLSDTGEVVAIKSGEDLTIVFFEVRGVIDHYSGWVFRTSGELGADEDPLGGGGATVERIDDHWFHVVAS